MGLDGIINDQVSLVFSLESGSISTPELQGCFTTWIPEGGEDVSDFDITVLIFVTNEPNNLLIPPGGNYPGSDNCYTCNGEEIPNQVIMKERQELKSLLNTVVNVH